MIYSGQAQSRAPSKLGHSHHTGRGAFGKHKIAIKSSFHTNTCLVSTVDWQCSAASADLSDFIPHKAHVITAAGLEGIHELRPEGWILLHLHFLIKLRGIPYAQATCSQLEELRPMHVHVISR